MWDREIRRICPCLLQLVLRFSCLHGRLEGLTSTRWPGAKTPDCGFLWLRQMPVIMNIFRDMCIMGPDLQSQLPAIQNGLQKRVSRLLEVGFGPLSSSQQFLQNLRQNPLVAVGAHKMVPMGGSQHIALWQFLHPTAKNTSWCLSKQLPQIPSSPGLSVQRA